MLARSAHVQRCACSQRRRLSVWGRRIRARPVAPASASAPAVSSSSGPPRLVDVNVRKASTAAELRAAAYLRAISFYTYPEGRSEFAARSHRRMKADTEWETVTKKVEGRDEAYKDLDVSCFVACVADDLVALPGPGSSAASVSGSSGGDPDRQELLAALRAGLDASAQLPADPAAGVSRQLVVGSLDLNVGHTLPSEELIGRQPKEDPRHRRAYLSNVCVAPAARRMGLARALLRVAEEEARSKGVQWLYVHVVADNQPAVKLYCEAMGFEVEQAESEGYARSLQRPRRLILAKELA
ncbi:hypothetical protein CHLRE_02g084550v5 [Chlamydomonas reinhardtii]|uniref:N-acetyltransferase domain-containing protein n=1 Tax=Chlamydomonas reinhardtii TaxID=3055 RepID=A0A2K3E0Q6_CHLRE|nr:uncharacterized protein CHLRE_02g084550v5 [Chlamydomonas reinhardtii]PNW86390.1 hypothetical protein CHLRE_02g084550v5 [Chlamydomonas reinhardtii]